MIKVSKILTANDGSFTDELDHYVLKIHDIDGKAGYSNPANLSGNPDNWSPEESEPAEIHAFSGELWDTYAPTAPGSEEFTEVSTEGRAPDGTFTWTIREGLKVTGNVPDDVINYLNSDRFNNLLDEHFPVPDNDYGGDDWG